MDIIQQKFGKILVLREVSTGKPGKYYEGQCECGLIKNWYGSNLRNGTAIQCRGCASKEHSKSFDDPTMIGKKFGELVVLSAEGSDIRGKLFKTQCICGDIKIRSGTRLKSGKATICSTCARKRRFHTLDKPSIMGKRFGWLVVIKTATSGIQGKKRYECLCDCGVALIEYENNLKRNKRVQCRGCASKKTSERFIDPTMIGRRFGRLFVIKAAGSNGRLKIYECKCECGNIVTITGGNLKTGNSTQCSKCAKPGRSTHQLYDIWKGIMRRCNDPNFKDFHNYGGRGIKICKRWEECFENFCADMEPRPDGLHIDRIDNDGNYEPGNCRWVTQKENNSNRRCSPKNRDKYITIKKDQLCSTCVSNKSDNNHLIEIQIEPFDEKFINKNDLRPRKIGRVKPKHGYTGTVMYRIWSGMRARCNNPKLKTYRNYGGRGIGVCERWNDFTVFLRDMGERPPGMTLDRIDNDGNYEPGNCRWVTRQENNKNQRRSFENFGKYLTVRKDRLCLDCHNKFVLR